uniref:Uncharacterized protein n=1 Tax=Arundo donax TaxID=35708 RepID=A0A0A8ZV91_ARUDO
MFTNLLTYQNNRNSEKNITKRSPNSLSTNCIS